MEAQSEVNTHAKMHKLDPNGDVIFEIAGQKLLLCSKAMSLASPAFKAMFKPQYLEGQNLSSEQPPVIVILEDEYQPFDSMLTLLHHQTVNISDAADLLDLCLLADKWRCLEAIKAQVLYFMHVMADEGDEYDDERPLERCVQLFVAAYIVRDRKMVDLQTMRMAVNATPGTSYPSMGLTKWSHVVPDLAWGKCSVPDDSSNILL